MTLHKVKTVDKATFTTAWCLLRTGDWGEDGKEDN